MFPVKQEEPLEVRDVPAFWPCSSSDRRLLDSHLLDDNMLAVVIQPDRHFGGETKLPGIRTATRDVWVHISSFELSLRLLISSSAEMNEWSENPELPEVDGLVGGGGGASRGRALLAVGCFHGSREVRSQASCRLRLLRHLLRGLCLHWRELV